MKNRLVRVVEEVGILGELQNGLRKDRRGSDNLFTLTQLIEIARIEGRSLYVAFLDLRKAYDSVNRVILWNTLLRLGIPPKFVNHLRSIYASTSYRYWFGDISTTWIHSSVGLKQGCPLSPVLFALYLEPLDRALSESGLGFHLQHPSRSEISHTIPGQFFADDLNTIAEALEDLQRLLNICSGFASDHGLQFSSEKCKILKFSGSVGEVIRPMCLQGAPILFASQIDYLGVSFSSEIDYLEPYESKLRSKSGRLQGAIKHKGAHSYNPYTVTRTIWKSVAVPSLTYANDVLCLKEPVLRQLEQSQFSVGKAAVGGNFMTAKAAIKGELAWSTFVEREARSKLAYLGRLIHMSTNRTAAKVYRYLRAMGHGTQWIKRVEALDRAYGYGHPRGEAATALEWSKIVDRAVKENATTKWRQDIAKHPSLALYSRKEDARMEVFYNNDRPSHLLFLARSGALPTAARFADIFGESPECPLCGASVEDIGHILVECPKFESVRSEYVYAEELEKTDECVAFLLGLGPGCAGGQDLAITKRILGRWGGIRIKPFNKP